MPIRFGGPQFLSFTNPSPLGVFIFSQSFTTRSALKKFVTVRRFWIDRHWPQNRLRPRKSCVLRSTCSRQSTSFSTSNQTIACKGKAARMVKKALAEGKAALIMVFSECLNFSGSNSERINQRGCSSVARASRCQRECRRFESDHPLSSGFLPEIGMPK